MLEKKQLKLAVIVLAVLNVLTIAFFLSSTEWKADKEKVATVGNESITRQEWLNELEKRYGEETLRDLIDTEVILQMADQYGIEVSDKALHQELTMYKVLYGNPGDNGEAWEEKVEISLLLEQLLTKDVVIPEEELKVYYQENQEMFNLPTSFHLSKIVVKTKKEAEQTVKELTEGSSFATLAKERSLDEFSANSGGDIGFINSEDETMDPSILEEAEKMKPSTWSDPVKLESGYAILFLHEKIEGKQYSYKEVKEQIRRQMAIEQMETPVSPQTFWSEANVEWFYGNKEE